MGEKGDMMSYIARCHSCQHSELTILDLPELPALAKFGPLWHVHVDLAGPCRSSQYDLDGQSSANLPEAKAWVVIIVDYLTKVAEFVPVHFGKPMQIVQAFYVFWVCRYAAPKEVTTDSGTEVAPEFDRILARLGCEHITTSV